MLRLTPHAYAHSSSASSAGLVDTGVSRTVASRIASLVVMVSDGKTASLVWLLRPIHIAQSWCGVLYLRQPLLLIGLPQRFNNIVEATFHSRRNVVEVCFNAMVRNAVLRKVVGAYFF